MACEHGRPADVQHLVVGDVGTFALDREHHQAVALGAAQQMGMDGQIPMVLEQPALVVADLGQHGGEAREHLDVAARRAAPPPEQAGVVERHEGRPPPSRASAGGLLLKVGVGDARDRASRCCSIASPSPWPRQGLRMYQELRLAVRTVRPPIRRWAWITPR